MGVSTEFANDATGTGVQGTTHTCDGSEVTLIVEYDDIIEDTSGSFIKRVKTFPGLKIRCNRTATTIDFEWCYRETTFQAFPGGEGVHTVASAVSATMMLVDP